MRSVKSIFYFLLFTSLVSILATIGSGCAQIGAPTGGPKDTLAPVLVHADPALRTLHFSNNKIVFTFDEYIDVKDIENNLLVSPYPKKNPTVNNKLKTVTVLLKDSLLPNTTYSLNFGNAIMDIDEGNIIKNFTYVFSTGNIIDSEQVHGNVVLAASGLHDSTLLILLYKNLADSAVQTTKPNYITRADRKGNFTFKYLPPGDYNIYALKDDDGSKTYDAKTKLFAFIDHPIHVSDSTDPVNLYAYAEEEKPAKASVDNTTAAVKKSKSKDNRLRYTTSFGANNQDILTDLFIAFDKPLKYFDSTKIVLTDTNYNPIIPAKNITIDSTRKNVAVHVNWTESTDYRLIISKTAATDSDSVSLRRTDTLSFKTKAESDYGSILIRMLNFDKSKHPVLEFIQDLKIVKSVPLTTAEWSDNLFVPGDYYIRILFDDNNNGKWDPGSYTKKRQPEKVISFDKKLTIKADWDNEREIQL
jgi:Bacterial Ig-like domain